MKCGMITFHRAINYGGALQAYALQQALCKLGAKAEVMDYYCKPIESMYRPKLKDVFKLNNQKRYLSALLKNGILTFNNSGFASFREKYMNISPETYVSEEDLKRSDYDLYIAGSDQIWSYDCAGFDSAYFLTFVEDSAKKNAYAASFGAGSIPPELHEAYRARLSDFHRISVRESDGAQIIQTLLNRRVPVVPDPTLLLDKEEWKALLPAQRTFEGRYVLLYMIAEDKQLLAAAMDYASAQGAKVCYINDRLYRKAGVVNLRRVTPEQWLDLFMNAQAIFTNSFHGMAFSVNFGKKLYPKALSTNQKVNARILNLLNTYALTMEALNEATDTEAVRQIVREERSRGFDYLAQVLGDYT